MRSRCACARKTCTCSPAEAPRRSLKPRGRTLENQEVRPSPENLLDYREFPVLYVDDEPENLRLFVRGLRREFTVRTATGAAEGLALVRDEPVAVVLSDHRMAGMSGVEFLARVRELEPKAIRILVTAYGDAETLSGAINDGSIYRYVPKPWSPDELLLTVRRGIEVYALDRERDELVRELSTLHWVSKMLARELDLGALSRVLLGTVVDELGFDGATLLLFDEAGQTLAVRATRPAGGPASERLVELCFAGPDAQPFFRRLAAGEVQRLRAGRRAIADAVSRALLEASGAGEVLVLPLLGRSRALGALAVDDRAKRRLFSASDATLLEGISSQAGIAIGNARLVDDLRRSRQEVQRAERLGTLGTLAAGLAHEINNPLVSIHTFLSLAPGKRVDDDAEFWGAYHELACREVERIRGLVATMARLGRGGGEPASRGPCDLGELALEVVMLLGREARRRGVDLVAQPHAGTPRVGGVREQLQQVVLNLVLNALQATPAQGRVEVRTLADARGEGACVEVLDSGAGIPPEELERIFDPFYTTKDPDQGTGLGLTICHGIVSEHGGSIEVESRPGGGTTFRVRLPARERSNGSASPTGAALDPTGPGW